ncbi:hypothetical protein C173_16079 [Paenibacillus sp. FSL R7-277]|nr:hypothetical protein C173_16079 [Paenibacillus sp. FSL R7-277]
MSESGEQSPGFFWRVDQADVGEKPNTMGWREACGPNVDEKPNTMGWREVSEADVGEKPNTMGQREVSAPQPPKEVGVLPHKNVD